MTSNTPSSDAAHNLYRSVKLLLSTVDRLAGHLGRGYQTQDASREAQDTCEFAERALAAFEELSAPPSDAAPVRDECAGGINLDRLGWDEPCPKCGATMNDGCKFAAAPVREPPNKTSTVHYVHDTGDQVPSDAAPVREGDGERARSMIADVAEKIAAPLRSAREALEAEFTRYKEKHAAQFAAWREERDRLQAAVHELEETVSNLEEERDAALVKAGHAYENGVQNGMKMVEAAVAEARRTALEEERQAVIELIRDCEAEWTHPPARMALRQVQQRLHQRALAAAPPPQDEGRER